MSSFGGTADILKTETNEPIYEYGSPSQDHRTDFALPVLVLNRNNCRTELTAAVVEAHLALLLEAGRGSPSSSARLELLAVDRSPSTAIARARNELGDDADRA